jgi:hypothetical protein
VVDGGCEEGKAMIHHHHKMKHPHYPPIFPLPFKVLFLDIIVVPFFLPLCNNLSFAVLYIIKTILTTCLKAGKNERHDINGKEKMYRGCERAEKFTFL